VNCYGVKIPDRDICRYDIKINSHPFAKKDKALPKPVCREIIEAWKLQKFDGWSAADYANLKAVAYDGQSILLSVKPIKGVTEQSKEFLIELKEEGETE
jgi:hypothetical protein